MDIYGLVVVIEFVAVKVNEGEVSEVYGVVDIQKIFGVVLERTGFLAKLD